MDMRMKGKNVLVTGSTAGIGKGVAEAFAAEEAHVWINGRSADAVAAAVAQLGSAYPEARVRGVAADISLPGEADRLYDACTQDAPLDVLVNNVGVYKAAPFERITDEEWQRLFDVNVMSVVRLCRRALPDMMQRNFGRIVVISSESAVRPRGDMTHYSATKSCLIGLARALAETTKGTNVTVNSVLPGVTWTEGVRGNVTRRAQSAGIPLEQAMADYFTTGNNPTSLIQRFLTVEEVAQAVLLTACNAGMSGGALLIDGGVVRHI